LPSLSITYVSIRSGHHFSELSLFDFRCRSPAFSNIDALFDNAQGRLKCVASGDPAPAIYWIQPSGKAIKYSPPALSSSTALAAADDGVNSLGADTRNEAVLVLENPLTDSDGGGGVGGGGGLSGMYICVANNEAGNVTLTINVTWPHIRSSNNNDVIVNILTAASTAVTSPLGVGPASVAAAAAAASKMAVHQTPPTKTSNPNDGYVVLSNTPQEATAAVNRDAGQATAAVNRDAGQFTLTELMLAIVGTHLATVLLSLVCVPAYHWRYSRQTKPAAAAEAAAAAETTQSEQQQQLIEHLQQKQQQQLLLLKQPLQPQLPPRGMLHETSARRSEFTTLTRPCDVLSSCYVDPGYEQRRHLVSNR